MRSEEAANENAVPGVPLEAGAGWTTRVESLLNWSRSHSLTPLPVSAACCGAAAIEGGTGLAYGLDEVGVGALRYAPRHADLLIVGGPLTPVRVSAIRRVYAEMVDPKWVIAYGNCACSGGGYDTYATGPGLGKVLPVDIFIPGCPPGPEALLDGLTKLRVQIRRPVSGSS
jgi:NADH-quinone oxidoreductase subunit B